MHVQDKHKEPMNQGCPDLSNLQTAGAPGEEQPSCQGPQHQSGVIRPNIRILSSLAEAFLQFPACASSSKPA